MTTRRPIAWYFLMGVVCLLNSGEMSGQTVSVVGKWTGSLESAGGPLTFGLEITSEGDVVSAFVTNGIERIKVPRARYADGLLELNFDYYKSDITARLDDKNGALVGKWTKRKTAHEFSQMTFRAVRDEKSDASSTAALPFLGRWQVQFENSQDPAVGIFYAADDGRVQGTFLTTTGDFRYLHGQATNDGVLTLSCFDGSHAFLFRAQEVGEGKLKGDFWSGAKSHEQWTATRNDQAQLPDGFAQVQQTSKLDWGAIQFPDLNGQPKRLDDPEFQARARIIYLFGSWCPNCHDAGHFFSQLQIEFENEGLKVLGLAFEATGDFAEDSVQVKLYRDRHEIQYPLLVAGIADKEQAARAIPFLSRVKAFPTAIILDQQGAIRGVYSGFNGPATGDAYESMKQDFRRRIKEILAQID